MSPPITRKWAKGSGGPAGDEVQNLVAGCASELDIAAPLLKTGSEGGPRTTDVETQTFVANGASVRRLTPRECERLQGLPDDWTLIPWRGRPAADSLRYAALGDAVTANVGEWLGMRIAHA